MYCLFLVQENLTFHHQLDQLENDILKTRHELQEVQSMQSDAQVARDNAKDELSRQEDIVYR